MLFWVLFSDGTKDPNQKEGFSETESAWLEGL